MSCAAAKQLTQWTLLHVAEKADQTAHFIHFILFQLHRNSRKGALLFLIN